MLPSLQEYAVAVPLDKLAVSIEEVPTQIGFAEAAMDAVTPASGSSLYVAPLYVAVSDDVLVQVADHVTTAFDGVAAGIVYVHVFPDEFVMLKLPWLFPL